MRAPALVFVSEPSPELPNDKLYLIYAKARGVSSPIFDVPPGPASYIPRRVVYPRADPHPANNLQ